MRMEMAREHRSRRRDQWTDWEAIARLTEALQDIDEQRASLNRAFRVLTREVFHADMPEKIRADFKKFWSAGGCNLAQFREWRKGKRPREPVVKRGHLRLVTNQKRRNQVPRYRPRQNPDDGGPPSAA
jgi:hypothetical protein